ncbi:MAG: hypothetical protein AAFS10_19260, partial [Myxococcota bacterium]
KTAVNLTQTPEGQPQLELRSTHNARVGLVVNLEPNRWVAPHRELPQLERAGALDLEPEAQQQFLQALSHVSDTHNLRLPQGLNRPNEANPQHEPATVSQAAIR